MKDLGLYNVIEQCIFFIQENSNVLAVAIKLTSSYVFCALNK